MAYNPNIARLPDTYTGNTLGFSDVKVGQKDNTTQHALNGGSVFSVAKGGSYWTIDITYPSSTPEDLEEVLPFLDSLRGGATSFYVLLPQYRQPLAGYWDTSTAFKVAQNDIQLKSPKVLEIDRWSERGGILSAGDLLKLSNTDKVYMVTAVEHNTGTDVVNIHINTPVKFPSLVPLASLEVNNVLIRVSLLGSKTPTPQLQTNGMYTGFTISAREDAGPDTLTGDTEFTWYSTTDGIVFCSATIRNCEEIIKCQ